MSDKLKSRPSKSNLAGRTTVVGAVLALGIAATGCATKSNQAPIKINTDGTALPGLLYKVNPRSKPLAIRAPIFDLPGKPAPTTKPEASTSPSATSLPELSKLHQKGWLPNGIIVTVDCTRQGDEVPNTDGLPSSKTWAEVKAPPLTTYFDTEGKVASTGEDGFTTLISAVDLESGLSMAQDGVKECAA